MKATKIIAILLLLIFIYNFYGCSEDKKNAVAEYDIDKEITYDELNQFVKDWNYLPRLHDKEVAYKTALYDMLKNQMKRMDFFDRNLDRNETILQSCNRVINEEIIESFFQNKYLSKYTNDEFAKEIYEIMDKQVVYQQIVINKPVNATKETLDELEERVENLKKDIESGEDFSEMVIKYSEDTLKIKNKGYYQPIGWKQSLIDPVGKEIFQLNKGDIKALSTNIDYKIIRVTEINKIKILPFEEMKDKVISEIKNIFWQKAYDEYLKDKNSLIDSSSFIWNESALKQLAIWSNIKNFYRDIYQDTLTNRISNNDNEIILTYENSKIDYKEYLYILNNILIKNTNEDIKSFIKDAITTKEIIKIADSLGFREKIFNAFTQNAVIKDRLVAMYNQSEIEQKMPPLTEDNLHEFFKDHEKTIFYQLEKRHIYVITFENEKDSKSVYNKIKSGTEFEKIIGGYLVKTYIKERDGELKALNGRDKPIYAEEGFKLKVNEISEPMKFIDQNEKTVYAILKCKRIRPEMQLTYDGAKNIIEDEFKKYYRKELEEKIEKRLADKYHPKYNYDVLLKIIESKDDK